MKVSGLNWQFLNLIYWNDNLTNLTSVNCTLSYIILNQFCNGSQTHIDTNRDIRWRDNILIPVTVSVIETISTHLKTINFLNHLLNNTPTKQTHKFARIQSSLKKILLFHFWWERERYRSRRPCWTKWNRFQSSIPTLPTAIPNLQ